MSLPINKLTAVPKEAQAQAFFEGKVAPDTAMSGDLFAMLLNAENSKTINPEALLADGEVASLENMIENSELTEINPELLENLLQEMKQAPTQNAEVMSAPAKTQTKLDPKLSQILMSDAGAKTLPNQDMAQVSVVAKQAQGANITPELMLNETLVEQPVSKNPVILKEGAEVKLATMSPEDQVDMVKLMSQKKMVRPQGMQTYQQAGTKSIFQKANTEKALMKTEQASATMNMEAKPMLSVIDGQKVTALNTKENILDTNVKGQNAEVKVFDLSKLNTKNTQTIINQISDYIVQNTEAKKPSVDMTFEHHELGKINIHVQKAQAGMVNIEVQTHSVEGAKFFQGHQADLLGSLGKAGVFVSDFKLDSSSQGGSQFGSNSHSSNEQSMGQGKNGQNQAQSNNERQDSKRREEMWNYYRKEVA